MDPIALPGKLLRDRLYDSAGHAMQPTHANKRGVRYCYYQSSALSSGRRGDTGTPGRVSAVTVEGAVIEAVRVHVAKGMLRTDRLDRADGTNGLDRANSSALDGSGPSR